MEKNFVCYPAILSKIEGKYGYKITVPMKDTIEVEGITIQETIKIAKEALGMYLNELDELPKADDLVASGDDKLIWLDINLKLYDEKLKYKSITRAVTLPYYLNEIVKDSGINVSSLLQQAILEKLAKED